MNDIGIVRLEGLKIKNFKNIENGEIYFAERKKVQRGEVDEDEFKNIIGIYGQNGSGKTSCLNVLRLIQAMLSGNPLKPIYKDYIMIDKNEMGITTDFLIKINGKYYYVVYDIEIEKYNDRMRITNEKIAFREGNKTGKCDTFYKYNISSGVNKDFLDRIPEGSKDIYHYISNYESNNIMNIFGLYSTIFNPKLYDLVVNDKKNVFGIYTKIISSLRVFGVSRLSIFSINYFNENTDVGIRFRYKKEHFEEGKDKKQAKIDCGDIFVPFTVFQLDEDKYSFFEKTINNINKVLPSIIPDFTVEIKISEENRLLNNYNRGIITFLLVGKRKGKVIPLQYESNGIKKIISILSGLIEAYSNEGCLMAIDEIDSGVFEYLLGEIVYAFDNFANGQLIFTSHNMRILEKINYKNIFFATTDSKNVFVQFTNVKNHNNLRDLYYRYLANGDQNGNQYYDFVKTEDLIANLRVPKEDMYD